MFKVTTTKPKKKTYFLLNLDDIQPLVPSQRITIGVIKDRAEAYKNELTDKLADRNNHNLFKHIFYRGHEEGMLVIQTRQGDWVTEGFKRFIETYQKPFYMILNLPLTEKEQTENNIVYD